MGIFSEGIDLVSSPEGELLQLCWRGAHYTIEPHPLCWYERRAWWESESRVPPGEGAGIVELQMWRLQLRCDGISGCLTLDVVHYLPGGQWRVIKIHDAVDEMYRLEELTDSA